MSRESMNRRDFTKLSMAALGGITAGTVIGCGGDKKDGDGGGTGGGDGGGTGGGDGGGAAAKGGADCWTSKDKNICRGLNACKTAGKGEHDCAGKASCSSVAKHDCAGENDCACEGGCDTTMGENACKGKGKCHVPVSEDKWQAARDKFEKAMKAADKTFGAAPAKA